MYSSSMSRCCDDDARNITRDDNASSISLEQNDDLILEGVAARESSSCNVF